MWRRSWLVEVESWLVSSEKVKKRVLVLAGGRSFLEAVREVWTISRSSVRFVRMLEEEKEKFDGSRIKMRARLWRGTGCNLYFDYERDQGKASR